MKDHAGVAPKVSCNYVASEGVRSANRRAVEEAVPWARGRIKDVLLLRSPVAHITSIWDHNKGKGMKATMSAEQAAYLAKVEDGLEVWLHKAAGEDRDHKQMAPCLPNNYQTWVLGGTPCTRIRPGCRLPDLSVVDENGNHHISTRCEWRFFAWGACEEHPPQPSLGASLAATLEVVENAAVVGVLEQYEESVCLARSVLRDVALQRRRQTGPKTRCRSFSGKDLHVP